MTNLEVIAKKMFCSLIKTGINEIFNEFTRHCRVITMSFLLADQVCDTRCECERETGPSALLPLQGEHPSGVSVLVSYL